MNIVTTAGSSAIVFAIVGIDGVVVVTLFWGAYITIAAHRLIDLGVGAIPKAAIAVGGVAVVTDLWGLGAEVTAARGLTHVAEAKRADAVLVDNAGQGIGALLAVTNNARATAVRIGFGAVFNYVRTGRWVAGTRGTVTHLARAVAIAVADRAVGASVGTGAAAIRIGFATIDDAVGAGGVLTGTATARAVVTYAAGPRGAVGTGIAGFGGQTGPGACGTTTVNVGFVVVLHTIAAGWRKATGSSRTKVTHTLNAVVVAVALLIGDTGLTAGVTAINVGFVYIFGGIVTGRVDAKVGVADIAKAVTIATTGLPIDACSATGGTTAVRIGLIVVLHTVGATWGLAGTAIARASAAVVGVAGAALAISP
jgi:hypothetical protein